ncbi:hypothetical protein PFISCL1PPCAC_4140, partial [Pristionchus fissidentatus]
ASSTMKNVFTNKNALVTPFDVHATIRSITDLPATTSGSSLLDVLPASLTRDCLRLPVPLQHCPCPTARINYTDTATRHEAVDRSLEAFGDLLRKSGCKRWDLEKIYDVRKLEKLPLVEVFVTVRPQERMWWSSKYDGMDFPVFKLLAEERVAPSGERVFRGLPELSVALNPVDYTLSTCAR